MFISHIAPIQHLYITHAGDFDFALAHIADRNVGYLNFFDERAKNGRTVLLDNGVWETGEPIKDSILIDLAFEMKPTFVYAPDYLNHSGATFDATSKFLKELEKHKDFPSKIIAVAQGNTLADWTNSVFQLSSLPAVTMIAIPALIIPEMFPEIESYGKRLTHTRIAFCERLNSTVSKYSNKLFYATGLGSPMCAKALPNFKWLWGVDTTMASLLATEGKFILDDGNYKPTSKLDFHRTLSGKELDLTYDNIWGLNIWIKEIL